MSRTVFSRNLIEAIKTMVYQHHTVYPTLPPQGIYFEALVERAFRTTRQPFTPVEPSTPNSPMHDLMIRGQRISIKTETGKGTRPDRISITKLCTTERDPWEAESLRRHVVNHLGRYDHMLMLRAIWEDDVIQYQAVDIPLKILREVSGVVLTSVGKRKGRRSIGGDFLVRSKKAFHVHFDGSDGKCQIRDLRLDLCRMLGSWDYQIPT